MPTDLAILLITIAAILGLAVGFVLGAEYGTKRERRALRPMILGMHNDIARAQLRLAGKDEGWRK